MFRKFLLSDVKSFFLWFRIFYLISLMTGTEIVFNINEITSLKTKDDVLEKNNF